MDEKKVLAIVRDLLKRKPEWESATAFRRYVQNYLYVAQVKGVDLGLKFNLTVIGVYSRELGDFLNSKAKFEGGIVA